MSASLDCAVAYGLLGCVVIAGGLVACGGTGYDDLFAPVRAGSGACTTIGCGSHEGGANGGASGSSGSTAAGSGGGSGTSGAGSGGGPETTSATTSGGPGGATGGSGAGAGGAPAKDAGSGGMDHPDPLDASIVDVGSADAVRLDARADRVVARDACTSTDVEICDGLDNDCNGLVDDPNACPSGCIGAALDGMGYMLCYGLNQQRGWNEAAITCTNAGGMQLVRVDGAVEDAFLREVALRGGYRGAIWIGGDDQAKHGAWVWRDGTAFWMGLTKGSPVAGQYVNWDVGQPNNATGNEHCVAKFSTDAWHDADCLARYAFACKR